MTPSEKRDLTAEELAAVSGGVRFGVPSPLPPSTGPTNPNDPSG